ncbi:cation-transporting P-type ATPase [Klebsiella pneumoniae]|uniref:Cation-transporting P-type ATPase n=1 Tax=Klebsiella pneumoniae TaxID=573 RepID=A0A447S3P1_KLEPN|nr:cation-transporting P-type ATPase [Klebsiella pneumoniae]
MNTDKPGAPYYQRSVEETLASVQSSPEGISGTEAATRLQQYGENALPQKPGKPAWLRFIAHFKRCADLRPAGGSVAQGGDGPIGSTWR